MNLTVTKITPELVDAIMRDTQAAIQAVAAKHGVAISTGRGTYNPTDGTAKFPINVAVPTSPGEAGESIEAITFKREARFHGLKPEHLGTEFMLGGKKFKLTGLIPRSRSKKPFTIQNVATQKGYVVDALTLLRVLKPLGQEPSGAPAAVVTNVNPLTR